MVKCPETCKVRYVMMTFLSCNRGKKFTAKQICSFIITNKLHDKTTSVNPSKLYQLVKSDYACRGLLQNVKCEKKNNRTYYWID